MIDRAHQVVYLSDALASGDAFLVVLALKEIGTARRIPVALDENPPLREVLRVLEDLEMGLFARHFSSEAGHAN